MRKLLTGLWQSDGRDPARRHQQVYVCHVARRSENRLLGESKSVTMTMAQDAEQDWSVHALIIALCLHAAVLFLFPYLNQEPLPFPVRVEIEMASMTRPVEKPAETPPQQPVPAQEKPQPVTKPEPKPVVEQQVLTAPPDSEPAQPDYVVPETPTPAATSPPTPPPVASPTTSIAPASNRNAANNCNSLSRTRGKHGSFRQQ